METWASRRSVTQTGMPFTNVDRQYFEVSVYLSFAINNLDMIYTPIARPEILSGKGLYIHQKARCYNIRKAGQTSGHWFHSAYLGHHYRRLIDCNVKTHAFTELIGSTTREPKSTLSQRTQLDSFHLLIVTPILLPSRSLTIPSTSSLRAPFGPKSPHPLTNYF